MGYNDGCNNNPHEYYGKHRRIIIECNITILDAVLYLWTSVMIRLKGLYATTCTRTLQPESTEIMDSATVQKQSHSQVDKDRVEFSGELHVLLLWR